MNVRIDVFHHSQGLDELKRKLDEVLYVLKSVLRKEVIIVATLDDLVSAVGQETTVQHR